MGDPARMSELQYGKIPELEKQLEAATQLEGKTMRLLRNKVTDAEIAEVLARWTGIPVSRMMESERENCCVWSKNCTIALLVRTKRLMRYLTLFVVAVRAGGSKSPDWFIPVSRPNGCGENRAL